MPVLKLKRRRNPEYFAPRSDKKGSPRTAERLS